MIRFLKYCFAETSLLWCSTASVLVVESLFFLESLILTEVRRSLGGKNFSEHLLGRLVFERRNPSQFSGVCHCSGKPGTQVALATGQGGFDCWICVQYICNVM